MGKSHAACFQGYLCDECLVRNGLPVDFYKKLNKKKKKSEQEEDDSDTR